MLSAYNMFDFRKFEQIKEIRIFKLGIELYWKNRKLGQMWIFKQIRFDHEFYRETW